MCVSEPSVFLHYRCLGTINDLSRVLLEAKVVPSSKSAYFLFMSFICVCPLLTSLSVHPSKKNRQTCVRKSLICAFAMAFIISVMLIAANQMLRNGME